MFALEVKHNPAGDAFEIEKGNGDVRDYNIRAAAAAVVLYDTSTRCTYSSLDPLVPDAALHVRATSRATPSSCDGGEGEAQFPHGTWTHCEAPPCVESAVHTVV